MVHTGAPKGDMTFIRESLTYNACEQRWTCNMCSRAEKPQDIQNMIRHILWRKRKTTKEQSETVRELTVPIAHARSIRIETIPLKQTQQTMPDITEPEPQGRPKPDTANQSAKHKDMAKARWRLMNFVKWDT